MRVTSAVQYIEATEGGIREGWQQIKEEDTTPLINDLDATSIFRVKDKEGEDSIMELVTLVCQLLTRDLRELQELVDTMEPVKSWDKG